MVANGEDADSDAQGDSGGVAIFDGRTKTLPSKSKKSTSAASTIEEEETSRVPPLMNPELPHLAAVLDKADVVIELLDARDPLSYRSKALETQVSLKEGQRLLLVLNKIGAYIPFPHFFPDVAYIYGYDRRLPSRADGRMGCASTRGIPDTALPRCIIISPT